MQVESQELPWRRNAAAVIVDAAGRVLLGKSPGENGYWHFPQGGAIGDEDISQTVCREVFEEVGLKRESYTVVQSLDGLRYAYRSGHRRTAKWSGQQQTYFLLLCHREKPRTTLGECKEFIRTRWTFPKNIKLEMFTPSKRKVIETVLISFLGMTSEELNRPLTLKKVLKLNLEEGKKRKQAGGNSALSGKGESTKKNLMKKAPTGKSETKKTGTKPGLKNSSEKNSTERKSQKTAKTVKAVKTLKPESAPLLLLTKQTPASLQNMDMNRYLVKPGSKVKLSDFDPCDKSQFEGTKEESFIEFNQLREEMQFLQKLLFAENRRKILVIIQAMDTGGKDGCIRHVFGWIDPQGINVVAFKKPGEEELGHDFLWRVHKAAPGAGQITIFNRSHYEDIIAVRARNLFPEERWKKRYRHILEFERLLAEEGTVIVKLFLNISKAEQKRRIEDRLKNPDKYWKFQPDDLIDRSMWDTYQNIYADVIEKTATDYAPWYIIPADRKWYRNLIVARLFVDLMHKMDISYPTVNFDPSKIVVED